MLSAPKGDPVVTVRAREIEEAIARAGGDCRVECFLCHKPKRALCNIGTLEYEDGSERRCPQYSDADIPY